MVRVVFSMLLASAAVFGQNVISAKAGLVNTYDGDVKIAGEPIQTKASQFVSLKVGQELRTGEGRAELLMTPGVFLRMGENSGVKMISNSLTDPRVEILQGSALIACMEVIKDTPITVVYGDRSINLVKAGLYRFDVTADNASLRVYEGEAQVGQTNVKKGREIALNSAGETKEIAKFDTKDTDELYRWASRRDEYIAMANVSAAKAARDTGHGLSDMGFGYGSGYGTGFGGLGYGSLGYFGQNAGWRWNPFYGMFTYVPYSGIYTSPFGWNYFSPTQVAYLYYPANYGHSGSSRFNTSGSSGPAHAFNGSQSLGMANSRGSLNGGSFGSPRGGFNGGGGGMSGGGGSPAAGGGAAIGSSRGGGGAAASTGGRGH